MQSEGSLPIEVVAQIDISMRCHANHQSGEELVNFQSFCINELIRLWHKIHGYFSIACKTKVNSFSKFLYSNTKK